jgi:uncharacterized membrane protein
MAPLIVQIVATLLARLRVPWRDAARLGLAVMFIFTAASHFSSLRHDLAAMIPPPLTGAMWLIYLSGILEFAGAVGLLIKRFRVDAAWALVALLVAMFPANVYAALAGVTLGGAPATNLLLRTPLQLFWIAALWWSTIAGARRDRSSEVEARVTTRINAPADRIYGIVADYHNGHPRILPPQLRNLVVEQGGIGAGTIIRCEMRAFGATRKFRATVTEPKPGRVLVETLDDNRTVTTFIVEPVDDGRAADVTISTRTMTRPGLLGLAERTLTSRFLVSVYEQELALLATVAGTAGASTPVNATIKMNR